MHDGDINYSKFSVSELEEALAGINKKLYPKNHENLLLAYKALRPGFSEPQPQNIRPEIEKMEDSIPEPRYDDHGRYIPNQIPLEDRIKYLGFSLFLFAYGFYGVWVNDLYIPGKRSRGMHFHDIPAWILYGAMICACIVMLSVVVDHYDRRDNEKHYRAFADTGKFIGFSLFAVSFVMAIMK